MYVITNVQNGIIEMKKSRICLLIILMLAVSCTKSRFATTTRHYHDGKVSYSNHYSIERTKLNRHQTKRPPSFTQNAKANSAGTPVDNADTIKTRNLLAYADKKCPVVNNMQKLNSQYTLTLYPEFHHDKVLTPSKHDRDTFTKDRAIVSFKDILRGDSTTVKKRGNSKDHATGTGKKDNRKTEKLGLAGFILSFLGILPLIGIPFSLLAIIFGAISLKKIKRAPEKYKGKGFAIASIGIGCAMIVMYIAILIGSISVTGVSAPSLDTSALDCRID